MRESDHHKVSVIIPAFNAATFLRKAVSSAVQQGRCIAEIIIVNNISTDDTAEVIDDLVATHGDLIVPTRCEVQGPAAARNHGIRMAKGEWIQFLDADDYLYAGKVARQLGLVDEQTEWVMGISDVLTNGNIITTFWLEDDPWKGLALCRGLGDTNANLFRRAKLLAVGMFEEDMLVGEDYHLYFKLLQTNVSYVRDEIVGSAYVQHDGFRGDGRGSRQRFKHRFSFVQEVVAYLQTSKADYYVSELPFYNAARVCALRMYMTGDVVGGRKIAARMLPNLGAFREMDVAELPQYWWLYEVVGFRVAESVRVMIRNLLSKKTSE